ncbi:MAG: B12-binding domain-containing radical SAM protein, partial [Oscillospiraceae bacterium]|nr:B12-binding domain-containing radical SAM protein [Oscillospiraceae bacterium]MCL2280116.1 B12-binding domain-containing radical SAM protein [Oscillospiraceae bacterium]
PDILCVSSYIWSARILPGILSQLRLRLPNTVFVLGGPEAAFNADYWLDELADYVLTGEGEYVLPPFLDALTDGVGLKSGKLTTGTLCTGGANLADRSDKPVDPYTDDYFAALKGRLAYIETSRGCPFSCAFCLSAHDSVKFFPLKDIKNQIRKLAMSDTKTIKFVDRTFNSNPERAYEIFEFCLSLDVSCKFHFEVAADLFDERTLLLLEAAPHGRFQFETGIQSFCEPALLASSRKTDLRRVAENITCLTKNKNIHIHVDLIAGLPYETLDEFKNSFNRAYGLNAHTLQLGFLKLLHGSVLRSRADELGLVYSNLAPYEIISNPWLSESDIMVLKQAENALQHTYNKGRFLSALDYVFKVTKLTPFALYSRLGESFPNHGTQLEDYACQVFSFCAELSGVVKDELIDHFLYDWLSMVKGKNAPEFLKPHLASSRDLSDEFEKHLGRKYRRGEAGVLSDGSSIFVDSENRNPVTGLYRVSNPRLNKAGGSVVW